MNEKARLFCALSGLTFLAVSGDGWLDTKEQSDLRPVMWMTVLKRLKEYEDRLDEIKYGGDYEGQIP